MPFVKQGDLEGDPQRSAQRNLKNAERERRQITVKYTYERVTRVLTMNLQNCGAFNYGRENETKAKNKFCLF